MSKVICIDNFCCEKKLTINKIYTIKGYYKYDKNHILIINDLNLYTYFIINKFISLDEYREKRLKLILNE